MNYTEHRDFKGVWFPAEVIRDRKLSIVSKKIYVLLLQKAAFEKTIKFETSTSSLSEYFLISQAEISTGLTLLHKNDYIKLSKIFKSDKAVFNELSGNYSHGCLFCGYNEIGLDKHHYPIRAKEGGTKIIKICPNCHRLFHLFADHKKRITIINKQHIEDFLEVWGTK